MSHPQGRPDGRLSSFCESRDCSRPARAWSNYCEHHAQRIRDTRSPHGRRFRAGELRPHRVMAEQFLEAHADHPATLAALDYMRTRLTPNPFDDKAGRFKGAIAAQVTRLREGGAEPREMLLRFLTVAGRITDNPLSEVARDHACGMFNLGRHVLLTTPLPMRTGRSGKRESVRIRATVCGEFGQSLMDALGGYQSRAWAHIRARRIAQEQTAATIREALSVAPFDVGPRRDS